MVCLPTGSYLLQYYLSPAYSNFVDQIKRVTTTPRHRVWFGLCGQYIGTRPTYFSSFTIVAQDAQESKSEIDPELAPNENWKK